MLHSSKCLAKIELLFLCLKRHVELGLSLLQHIARLTQPRFVALTGLVFVFAFVFDAVSIASEVCYFARIFCSIEWTCLQLRHESQLHFLVSDAGGYLALVLDYILRRRRDFSFCSTVLVDNLTSKVADNSPCHRDWRYHRVLLPEFLHRLLLVIAKK